MASLVGRAGIPPQPSTGFLRKCAKEQEKLRTKLHRQLQHDMLQLLDEGYFSDITIKSSGIPTPLAVKIHQAILKVRVPAFLCEVSQSLQQSQTSNSGFNSYLSNVELLSFLRKVYSEDDIRRHECEAVRLNKKYSEEGKLTELVSSTQETSTNKIEEESLQTSGGYLSSNGDIYLTPISSPLSPEKKVIRVPEEVLEITVTEEESEKDSYNVSSFRDLKLVMKTKDNNKLVTECDVNVKSEESNDQLIALQNSSQNLLSTEVSSSKICLETNFQGSSPSSKEKEPIISLPEKQHGLKFEKMDLPRSDTFEIGSSLLQENSQDVLKEKAEVAQLQEIIVPKTDKKKESFFLHNKVSIPKDKEEKSEPPIITSHVQTLSTYHLEGSMTDSGFMSQSQSLMSDTEFSSSLMCSMMNCSSVKSSTGEKVLENIDENNQLSSSVCSGSLFPLYVDMNNVIPEENIKTAIEKKQQDPNLCTDSTGTLHDDTQAAYSSKPHVISLETLEQSSCSERNKGNSCYMYVDLDSIKPEESERLQTSQQKVKEKKHPMSVSMFVEMNGKINDSVRTAQEMYTSLIEIGTEKLKNSKVQDRTDSSTQIINPESSGYQEKHVPLRMVQQEECLEHNNSADEIAKQIKGTETKSVDEIADSSCQVCSEEGLLPMSPIMKRKVVKQELLRSPPEDIAVKESIKPQDLNALAFPLNVSMQTLRSISKDSLEETFGQDIDPDKTESLYSYKEDIVTLEEQQIDVTAHSIQQKAERYPPKIFKSPEETTHFDDKVPISEKNQPKLEDSTIIKTCIANIDSKKPSTSIVKQLSMSEKTTSIKTTDSELKSYEEEVSSGTELDELDRGNEEVIFTPTVKHSRITPELGHSSVEKIVVRNSKSKIQVSLNDSNEQDTNELKENVETVTEIALENQQKLNESMKQLVSPPPEPTNFKTPKSVLSHQIKPAISRMHREFERSPEKIERPRITEKQLNVEKQFEFGKKQKVYQNLESRKENVHKSEISQFLSPFPPPSSCDLEDDSETIYSEVSDISSSILGPVSFNTLLDRASQHGRNSPEGSTSNKFHEACSKLGEDLLRMFLEEINADVIIRLSERDIKAHKCILVSRCKYFEAMLRGNWSENTDDIIKMQGYSYSAVHFALCHIYSGDINLPKGANIAELAQLSDMLGLDSLKEVVVFHLKMNYCHFFHRPCNQCINGVVECLSLTKSCGLQELQNKSIRWMGKYFTRIWTHKAFAMLSNEFQEKCYQSALQNLTVETSVEMLLSCDRLLASLPRIKWAEPVYGLVTRLIQNCIHFIAVKFDKVVTSDGFLALGKGQSWNVTAIEDNILSAVEQLTPDIACRTYVQLGQLLPMAETQGSQELGDWTENFLELLHRLQRQSERYLIHHANHVIHCTSWNLLAPEVQKKNKGFCCYNI